METPQVCSWNSVNNKHWIHGNTLAMETMYQMICWVCDEVDWIHTRKTRFGFTGVPENNWVYVGVLYSAFNTKMRTITDSTDCESRPLYEILLSGNFLFLMSFRCFHISNDSWRSCPKAGAVRIFFPWRLSVCLWLAGCVGWTLDSH